MSTPQQAILELLRRIKKLQQVAAVLADEYGIDLDALTEPSNGNVARRAPRGQKSSKKSLPPRAQELRDFFSQHGAATRAEIREATGIPMGTVGVMLTRYGRKLAGGRWEWNDQEK